MAKRSSGTTSEPRRERRKRETRERIIREAARLFDQKGFERTTVDEIVRRADVSKGTFFNYFERKDSILSLVADQRHARSRESAAEILSLAVPVRDKILAIFAEAAEVWEEDPGSSRHALRGLAEGALRQDRERGAWSLAIRECVDQGRKSGEFRSEIDAARAEALLTAIFHDALRRWSAREGLDLQEEVRELVLLALDGLAG